MRTLPKIPFLQSFFVTEFFNISRSKRLNLATDLTFDLGGKHVVTIRLLKVSEIIYYILKETSFEFTYQTFKINKSTVKQTLK